MSGWGGPRPPPPPPERLVGTVGADAKWVTLAREREPAIIRGSGAVADTHVGGIALCERTCMKRTLSALILVVVPVSGALGAAFTEISTGLASVDECGLAWGDYDNDGYPDLLLTGRNHDGSMTPLAYLYRNVSFASAGSPLSRVGAGLAGVKHSSAAWGDFDNDGHLDAVVAGSLNEEYEAPPTLTVLYRNANGTFEDTGAALANCGRGTSCAWGDFDNDGDLDLALAGQNASGLIAVVYENQQGTFIDIGAGLPGMAGCSLAWADYDDDGVVVVPQEMADEVAKRAKMIQDKDRPGRRAGYEALGLPLDETVG